MNTASTAPGRPKLFAETLLDLFFPRQCIGCGTHGTFLCFRCEARLVPVGPACPRCGKPRATEDLCPPCWRNQSKLDAVSSPYRFEGIMRQAIHELKYRQLRAMAQPLGILLAVYLQKKGIAADCMVPVPLHPHRLRERGYNQSNLLAREAGKRTGIPVMEDILVRTRHTPPQVRSANAAIRNSNVSGAFSCRTDAVGGKRIIVIDDVCTSGATLEACAAVLKERGAAYVVGITLAREV